MSYNTAIVKAVLDSPKDFEPGFSGVVLDDTHTIVLASDSEFANPGKTKQALDDFVAEYETVSSHPGTKNVRAELRERNGNIKDSFDGGG